METKRKENLIREEEKNRVKNPGKKEERENG